MELSIRNRFAEFQRYARWYNLVQFSYRVLPGSITFRDTYSVYPSWLFDFFEEMLSKMSQEERGKYHHSTVLLYRRLLLQKARGLPFVEEIVLFLSRTFTLLLRFAQNRSFQDVWYLVFVCKAALDVETGVFLRIVSREDQNVVRGCLPPHRFNGWGIRNSRALMQHWVDVKLSLAPLLQYGFPYQFDREYFQANLRRIIWPTSSSLMVNGKELSREISTNIFSSGNLRMQLAVDLLLVHFDVEDGERRERNKIFLKLLWRAVPFPCISSAEMFTLLKPFFKQERLSLQELCDEYKKSNFIFEVPEVSEPRTLMHLCRVQFRKSLCKFNTTSVDELIDNYYRWEVIPHLMKDYLKLKEN